MKIVKKPVNVTDIKKHGCGKSDKHPSCQSSRSN